MVRHLPPPRGAGQARLAGVLRSALLIALIGLTGWRALLARPARQDARQAFARKDYATSLRRAEDDLLAFPRSRESMLLAARSLSLKRYADEAEPFYRAAEASGPIPLPALQDRAQGLILSNQPDRATAACHALLKRFPDDPTTLRYLATLEYARGRAPQAIDAAERLARTQEGRATGFALLREVYHEAKRFELAARAGEELVRVDPGLTSLHYDHMTFWYELGDDLLLAGRPDRARELLAGVVEQAPNAELLDLLATAYFRLEEIDEAERVWNRSAAIDPRRVNPPYRLGLIAMGRKRHAEAAEWLEKAAALDTTKPEPAYNLAKAYRALGKKAEAERMERKAEELRASQPPARGGMGPSP